MRVGFEGSLGISGIRGWCTEGIDNTHGDDLLGNSVDANVNIGILGAGVWSSLNDNNIPVWVGISFGVGLGEGASIGKGTTYDVTK